jgi:hypothetical protein
LGITKNEKLKFWFLIHIINEIFINGNLKNLLSPLLKYWIPTILYNDYLIKIQNYFLKINKKKINIVLDSNKNWSNDLLILYKFNQDDHRLKNESIGDLFDYDFENLNDDGLVYDFDYNENLDFFVLEKNNVDNNNIDNQFIPFLGNGRKLNE